MFRQIVSNLAFSPALVGQLGFYAKRLKKEEVTRRAGLVFTALALIIQSLTVFTPPEAANAASAADFIPGGVSGKQDFLNHYDNNTGHIKSLLASIGIYRSDVAAMRNGSITAGQVSGKYNWSRTSLYSHADGQRSYTFDAPSGKDTVYYRPLRLTQEGTLPYPVLEGHSATFGYFAIKLDCGNLITNTPPSAPPELDSMQLGCTNLNVVKVTDNRYRATARASVKGTTINYFRFTIEGKDNDKTVKTHDNSASVEFNESQPGTYTVRAYVHADGFGARTSPECRDTFTIPQPNEPWARCVSLTPTITHRTQISLAGQAEVRNGATISRYTYVVKNSNGRIIKTIVKDSTKTSNTAGPFNLSAPGDYRIELTVKTSAGDKTGGNCISTITITQPPEPYAECKDVSVIVSNRTIVSASGSAAVGNGATVSRYTFVVRDKNGREVHRTSVNSIALSATANSFTMKPGDYNLQLYVTTSLGEKTGDQCIKSFTITPPNVCPYNPLLPENSPECQPCPTNPEIWIKDERCNTPLLNTKTAKNMTQGGVDATTVTAKAGDRISYKIVVRNNSDNPQKVAVTESLADILEYAELTHGGGGTLDPTTKVLSWSEETVEANKSITHEIVVQMLGTIPATNTGTSNGASYDCVITNTFGNTLNIGVDCPAQKQIVEQVVKELPSTGPSENILFAGVVGSIVTYFYARSRQLGREVKLVRKDFNMGTI